MTAQTAIVPFQGCQLATARHGDVIYVALRPIAERLGLVWSSQLQRLRRHAVFAPTVFVINTVDPNGRNREQVALPIGLISGWLCTINATRIRPELRDELVAFQRECFDAIDAYWRRGWAANPRIRIIDDSEPVWQDQKLDVHGRFIIEKKRWEARNCKPLVDAGPYKKARLTRIELYQEHPVKKLEEAVGLLGLGLDLEYILWGRRSLTAGERDFMLALRAANSDQRADLIAHAETIALPG